MAKNGATAASAPKDKVYAEDYLAPLFGQPGENGEDPILAKDIMGIRLYFMEPDPRVQEIAPQGVKSGKIKVPSAYFDLAQPKNGRTQFEYNPFETTEDDFEKHFGKGYYFVQSFDHRNKWHDGRTMILGGPPRYQGVELEEEPEEPEEPEVDDDEDDKKSPVVEAVGEMKQMFQQHFAAPPVETVNSKIQEITAIAAIFKPDASIVRNEDTNARRIDDLMRDHRADLNKVASQAETDRQTYRQEVLDLRKKQEEAIEEIKNDYKEELREAKDDFKKVSTAQEKKIEELEKELRELRRKSSDDNEQLRHDKLLMEQKVLSAELKLQHAELHAKAAEKEADELEDMVEKLQARLERGSGKLAPASDDGVPGLPGWVNSLLPTLLPMLPTLLPLLAPMVAQGMKQSGAPIPADMPPWLQDQLRAAMQQPPPQPQGWGQPPPGWMPAQPPPQGPPPGWMPAQPQPTPPGWPSVQPEPPQVIITGYPPVQPDEVIAVRTSQPTIIDGEKAPS